MAANNRSALPSARKPASSCKHCRLRQSKARWRCWHHVPARLCGGSASNTCRLCKVRCSSCALGGGAVVGEKVSAMMAPVEQIKTCHPHDQERVADRTGLVDRPQVPAHPRGCPCTVRLKANPCAQHRKRKAALPKESAAAAPVKTGRPNPYCAFFAQRAKV